MTTYTWNYGSADSGLNFTITYDDSAGTFTVHSLEGSFDLNALWWSDNDTTGGEGGGTTLSKSDSSLNMNGTNVVWDGYEKLSSAGLGTAGTDKATYFTAGETETFSASSSFISFFSSHTDAEKQDFTLGVRATSVNGDGSIKLTDHGADVPPTNHPPVAVDDNPACGTEHTPVTGNVLANDSDPDGNPLHVTQVNGQDLTFDQTTGLATVTLAQGTLTMPPRRGIG